MNLGREVCGKESQASALEWLLANGLGGYASGTVSGRPTRGYHGLLVAAGTPAQGRVLLLAALAEEIEGDSGTFELATFGWQGGAVAPQGHKLIESFRLDGTMPVCGMPAAASWSRSAFGWSRARMSRAWSMRCCTARRLSGCGSRH